MGVIQLLGSTLGLGLVSGINLLRYCAGGGFRQHVFYGNLVLPEGRSAYDLYLEHKGQDLSATDKDEIVREVQTRLEQRGDHIFANLKQDQTESESEWNEANRVYAWLNELKPKSSARSKTLLCPSIKGFREE